MFGDSLYKCFVFLLVLGQGITFYSILNIHIYSVRFTSKTCSIKHVLEVDICDVSHRYYGKSNENNREIFWIYLCGSDVTIYIKNKHNLKYKNKNCKIGSHMSFYYVLAVRRSALSHQHQNTILKHWHKIGGRIWWFISGVCTAPSILLCLFYNNTLRFIFLWLKKAKNGSIMYWY